MQSWAVVAKAPWTVAFEQVEVPDPAPTDVVVRPSHSWISNGTEGSFVRGERIWGDTPWREGDPSPFPHVPGYQSVGTVLEVGSQVTHVKPGDAVFVAVGHVENMFFTFGGHMSPIVATHEFVWKLPDGLDPVAASGLVLTQVGWNAGTRPALQPGDAAVVLGDGMVGLWTAQTLQARGARVLLAGRHPERMACFKPGPNDALVNTRSESLVEAATRFAPAGIQVVAHTAGPIDNLEALYPSMKRFSHAVSAGFVGTEGAMDVQKMRDLELTLHTIAGWTRERVQSTLDWLHQGKLSTLPLITHRFPAERAADAFDLILHKREPFLGVVLDWEGVR